MTQLPSTTNSRSSSSILPVILTTGAFAFTGLGLALIAWSRTQVIHDVPLTAALDGDLMRFIGRRSGSLAYYAAGPHQRGTSLRGGGVPPLVFIHSINAAASSYEMKPLFEHYARTRRVIALDLPGYGFSDRRDRAYVPALMRDAILDLVEQELEGQPVDAVALSLSGEFLALAALTQPKCFRSLTFIAPTGFSARNTTLQPNETALRVLRVPAWSRPIYDLLTSRPSLNYFTATNQRTPVKRGFINYAYATSHQPDAEHAPQHFLSFKLFTPTIFQVYQQLAQSCLLIYGRDSFTSFEYADQLRNKSNWRIESMEHTGSLTHWDDLQGVAARLNKQIGK